MIDGSELFVTEYFTVLGDKIQRDKYSYHLQKNHELVIRWDNAPHHKELSTFPYHVHRKDGVYDSNEITVEDVLEELSEIVQQGL